MARVKSKVIDRDLGWKRIKREIAKARKKPHVAVGIFGSKASADHGGQPNIDVAATHEFGMTLNHPGGTAYFVRDGKAVFVSNEAAAGKDLPRTKPHKIDIPQRSFIKGTVDARKRMIVAFTRNVADQVLQGKMTTAKALEMLGIFVQGQIRARISRGISPPLKAATIRQKGSSKPLIDTGQLRGSVDYDVRNAR
jgi:hypothetical protein